MRISELPKEHFGQLEAIFDSEFDSDPPRPDHSRIFICHNDQGEPIGFVHAESFVLVGQVYIVPDQRESTISIAKSLLEFLRASFDGKVNVGAVASEPRFEKLLDSYGMQRIDGTFHRKNVDF